MDKRGRTLQSKRKFFVYAINVENWCRLSYTKKRALRLLSAGKLGLAYRGFIIIQAFVPHALGW